MKLTLITPPVDLPVDVEWAKKHSRVLGNADDALIGLYLESAVAELDGPTGVVGRCFMTQTWQVSLAGWVGPVGLRVEPVQSVAVFYTDRNDIEQELGNDNFVVHDGVGQSPELWWRGNLPALGNDHWPVRIRITAGRAEATADQKIAVLLRAADLYEHREALIVGTISGVNPAFDSIVGKLRRHL